MRYAAKIDWWIGLSIILGLILPVIVAITGRNNWMWGLVIAAWALVFGWCYPQWYATTEKGLVIRGGLRAVTIPYAQIISVRASNDSRSALPLSLDRVEIEYLSGKQLIAPKDQVGFFSDIASRAPQLTKRGLDLVISQS